MQFGMQPLIELNSLGETAALCHELGLGFIELNMNLPEYQINSIDVERLRRIANEHGISYTIHFDENLNPCDFNVHVSAAYTETVLATIEAVKSLGVPNVDLENIWNWQKRTIAASWLRSRPGKDCGGALSG